MFFMFLYVPLNILYHINSKNPSFWGKYFKIKSPSANVKGLEMSWLPLLDSLKTFCWGEIIEEL